MNRLLRFAARALWRDLRAGELTVLGLALVIAAGAVTTVGIFTARIEMLLVSQGAEVLAADLAVRARNPLPTEWRDEAVRRQLRVATTRELRSVVLVGDRTQLVEVKAVDPGYPLRGVLRTAAASGGTEQAVTGLPEPGAAWVDRRLLQLLDLIPGQRIELGSVALTVTRVLAFEPDRGMNLFSIGPRVLLGNADLDRSGLVLPASRVRYRLLIAGEREAVDGYRRWLEPRLGQDAELESVDEARPELRNALSLAAAFLNLAALAGVLLAGLAVAMAANRYSRRQADACAVQRCLGASRDFVVAVHVVELLLLGAVAGGLGAVLGFAVQSLIGDLVAGLLARALPASDLRPAWVGLLVAWVTLVGFALPPLLRLRRVSPLQVLRRELGLPPRSALAVHGLGAAATLLLMGWLSGDALLTGWIAGGLAATALALLLAAAGLVAVLGVLRRRQRLAWRLGLSQLSRRARSSVAQLVAFGLGLMVLLLLTVVRGDLLAQWHRSVPDDAPNLFLVNIQPDEVAALGDRIAALAGRAPPLYPMVRGRLVALNGTAVSVDRYQQPRARRLVTREFNLSHGATLPPGNRVVAGSWWDGGSPATSLASVEQGLAQTLGIALGDRLRFRVGASEVEATVGSLREVEWDSFRVNFFVILAPGILEGLPATYITSFRLPQHSKQALGDLVRQFPSVTAIDIDGLIAHLERIIDRVTAAVELVFAFTLLAGLAVLFAAIHATLDERRYEAALLKTLGARRRRLLSGLAAEFALLGGLAGMLGAAGASTVGWLLARNVFLLPYDAGGWVWIVGPLAGVLLVGLAGMAGTWRVMEQPPLRSLGKR